MFLERISYNTLTTIETIVIIVFVAMMLIATLSERRTWLLLTYTIMGFILTVVCVLQISVEVANESASYHTSILMSIIAALCTTIWAVMYGIRRRYRRRTTTEEEE
jgi:predicted membrane protein